MTSRLEKLKGKLRFGQEESEAFLSGIAIQAMLLVAGVIAARILGADGRGQQALIWIVALTAVQVGTMGFPLSLTFHSAKDESVSAHLMRHVRPLVLTQLAGIVIVYSVVVFLFMADRIPTAPALVTILALPAMVSQACGLAIIQGKHDFRAFHVLRCLPPGLFALGLLIGVLVGADDLTMVMSMWTASYVLAAVATSVYLRRTSNIGLVEELNELPKIREMIRFGIAGFLGSNSPSETFRVDQLLVGVFLSTTDLGLYVTALAFCNLPRFLAQALGLVAYPKIVAAPGYREKRSLLARYTAIGTAVSGLTCLLLGAGAAFLIRILFGADFSGAVGITEVLLLATVLLCIRRILSDGMRGMDAPAAGSIAELVALIALAPAALILVPQFGLMGFGWSMVVSYGVGLIALLFLLARLDRRSRTAEIDENPM